MNRYTEMEIESMQPRGFAEYMSNYGEHFSRAMCEWAVSMMKVDGEDGRKRKLEAWDRQQVEDLLLRYGVTIDHDKGYDKVYVANMCKADFFESSVEDESHLAKYVKDLLDDPDGYDGQVFNRFMMDCMGKGIPVMWEDML